MPGRGVEIKERWDVWRIGILIGMLIMLSFGVAIGYSVYTGDTSTGFAIAGTCLAYSFLWDNVSL